jgi:hypothetical protein
METRALVIHNFLIMEQAPANLVIILAKLVQRLVPIHVYHVTLVQRIENH